MTANQQVTGARRTPLAAEFDRGAPRYDLLVGLNPGYHRHLASAARELFRRLRSGHRDPHHILDLACGTGASTRALVGVTGPNTRILGVDNSEGMITRARRKKWPTRVDFVIADATRLDMAALGPGTWDGVFAGYLFRNLSPADRDAAASDVFDLLAPGGWLVAQDFSVAGSRGATARWDVVSWLVIIPLSVLLDGHPSLYRYLWRSVRSFDSRRRFMRRLTAAGFVDVDARTAPGWQHGILHTFVARKPAP